MQSPIATRDSEASFIPSLPATAPQWMPPGLAFSMRQSNWVRNNTQLPSPSTTTSRKRSRSNSPDIWTRRPPPGATAPSINKGPSALKAEELKRELLNVRREIEAGVIREASIIAKIRALGSSAPTREMPEETVLRERLKVVEAELLAETKLRLEAEAVLMDFQTECKEPFLVPAMFDMVDTISRLTTQALELIKAEGG
ncbi:hypothetical protein H0H87_003978 [Tephrocybe sp. NHM501043]|nr:hypothetical protein H0H87_003978 [Tephrocybe sp. NHM501043]